MAAAGLHGQATAPPNRGPIHIQAELGTAVKLAKAKVGDKLKAQVIAPVKLANGTEIAAGATVLGEVKQVSADSVVLAFDRVDDGGKKISINITLVAAAQLGGPQTKMSQPAGASKMESPSGGSLPNDHPLNGGGYSAIEAGNNAAKGVSHEALAEVNSNTKTAAQPGGEVHTTAGSVIGLPGVALTVDDGPPYGSKFQLGNKERQLPKGVQLMFTVR